MANQEALECSWNLQRTLVVSSCKKRPPATLSLNVILLNAKVRELTLNSELGENMDNVSATLLLVKGKEINIGMR